TYEGTASYTIDNSASTLDVAVSYFIDGVETTQAALVAGGTIGVVDIPINNGSTITVTATADRYPPVSVSDSLTGCVAPDVFVPTVAVELTCTDGTGTYRATIDNSTSNVDATVTVTVDGEAVGDPVTVTAGETEELTGSVANGQEVIATASSTGQTAVSDSDTLDGCVQIQVFGPSLSLSTACSAEGTGSYSATVDNTSSDMDVNVVVSIDGVDSDPVVVAAGGTETLSGTIDNDSTVTVTASADDDTRVVSATLTDCTPPPTTTVPETTTTTVPETTTTTVPETTTTPPTTLPATPAEDTTTTTPQTLPATGNHTFPSPTTWAALLLLSAGLLLGKSTRRRI
ncbi:MAG: LPXTG cell wall anchor domain-containing protein, partial [Ilumatobacteraceae bacterium]